MGKVKVSKNNNTKKIVCSVAIAVAAALIIFAFCVLMPVRVDAAANQLFHILSSLNSNAETEKADWLALFFV